MSSLWQSHHRTKSSRLALQHCQWARQHQRTRHAASTWRSGRTGFLKCSNLTAWVRALCCNAVYITHYRSMCVPVLICTHYFMAEKKALVDSGATDNFIHPVFAKRLGLKMMMLDKPKWIYNIDNMSNKAGSITHSLELRVTTKGEDRIMWFLVTDIGHKDILLRYPWLTTFNPKLDGNMW